MNRDIFEGLEFKKGGDVTEPKGIRILTKFSHQKVCKVSTLLVSDAPAPSDSLDLCDTPSPI